MLLSAVAYSENPDKCMQKIRKIEPRFDYMIFDDFIAERCDDFYFDYSVCVAMVTLSHANQEILIYQQLIAYMYIKYRSIKPA